MLIYILSNYQMCIVPLSSSMKLDSVLPTSLVWLIYDIIFQQNDMIRIILCIIPRKAKHQTTGIFLGICLMSDRIVFRINHYYELWNLIINRIRLNYEPGWISLALITLKRIKLIHDIGTQSSQ